jgi:regulator of sigma E protease
MVSGLFYLIVFILALGGMIFVHELGHFLAARWAKIEVEEFGFGFPPRAFGFWRGRGFLIFNRQRIEIPQNFGRSFDWQSLSHQPAKITVDQAGEKYILRTIEFSVEDDRPGPARMDKDQVLVDASGKIVEPSGGTAPAKKTIRLGGQRGMIEWNGIVDEVHPGTLFSLNWLPLGGFVRPKGENDPNVPGGLAAASPWKRLVVLFAGPVMNLFTAIVVFALLIGLEGMATSGPIKIVGITPDSPAEQAGLLPGDTIRAMNNEEITDVGQAIGIIQTNLDKPVEIEIERGTDLVSITATPLSSRTKQEGALGVGLAPATRPARFVEMVQGGATITAYQAVTIVYLPIALIKGVVAPDQARVIGFKGIYDMFAVAVKEDVESRQDAATTPGTSEQPSNYTLSLIGLLSVSLGVLNLMPIPALDGGRILFTMPEIILRRRIPAEWENRINGVAMLLLIMFMLFVNAMDFINPAQVPFP